MLNIYVYSVFVIMYLETCELVLQETVHNYLLNKIDHFTCMAKVQGDHGYGREGAAAREPLPAASWASWISSKSLTLDLQAGACKVFCGTLCREPPGKPLRCCQLQAGAAAP